jgi:FkbM family methyltransferase
MHKSELALGLATRAPTLAKGALWVWTRGAQWIGRDPQAGADHWLVREMVDRMQYRLPVNVRLGNGMKIKVHANDFVGAEIIRKGYYEPEIVRLFERFLKSGMTFLDIGAHVGQYTLIASKLVGPSGQVHSFEPDPQTYAWLDSNVKRNKLTNVVTNQAALADAPGKLEFFLSKIRDVGSNSLRPPKNFSGRTVEVRCLTVDQYLASHGVRKVDFLKIDVEGAECPALTGAKALLSGSEPPLVIVEFEEQRQIAFKSSCARLAELLKRHGYTLYRIVGDGIEAYVPRDPDAISFNVLAVPTNRAASVEGLVGSPPPA